MHLKAQPLKRVHGYYWVIPLISAAVWFVTLLVLLLTWIGVGRPKYPSMEGTVAFISDISAQFLKPLFVIGTILTSFTFVGTLASLLYLQSPPKDSHCHDRALASSASTTPPSTTTPPTNSMRPQIQTRLPAHGRPSERILAIISTVGAFIGGAGLVLLSGFDTLRYTTLHRIFLAVFMFGVALSALFTMIQFALLARSHRRRDPDDYALARISAILKGVSVLVLLSLAVAFTLMLSRVERGNTRSYDIAGILEWVIGFCFNFYLLTFVYDLRHARSRESVRIQDANTGL